MSEEKEFFYRYLDKLFRNYPNIDHIRSFLYDPFGDYPPSTYGLELMANRNIDINFFTKVQSKSDGIKFGNAWLWPQ
ncbi:MAG: hypothetical protein JSV23_03440 [Promethearchaeota archaeon]|nr:MAG: hypothetical protein JSV23_03440 [Candidatus Lokiarchaeota archaeon]